MADTIGFIGLGNMGFRMAGNIRKKTPRSTILTVFDVDRAASERFVAQFEQYGPIKMVDSAKDVAQNSSLVLSMVPMDKHAQQVYLDPKDGVIAAAPSANRLILECSTLSVKASQGIGKAITDAGTAVFVDTPVSGGTAGAEAGTLSFMVGYAPDGDKADLIRQTLSYMGPGDRTTFCGQLGMGLVGKIVNNYIGLSNVVTAAEGFSFGLRHGMDGKVLHQCIKGSSGDSWVINNTMPAPGVVETSPSSRGFAPGFYPRLCVKDVGLAIAAAEQVGIEPSMGRAALNLYTRANDDPRTSPLDHSSIWLHINDLLESFANRNGSLDSK